MRGSRRAASGGQESRGRRGHGEGDEAGFKDYGRRAYALAEKGAIRDFQYYVWYARRLDENGNAGTARDVLQSGLRLDPRNEEILDALRKLGKN